MESLREARCTSVDARGFTLDAGAGWSLSVAVVDDHTVRVLLSSRPSRPTWAVLPCPGAADVPKEGRERRELSGYPLPAGVRVDASPGDANTAILRTGALVVTATLRPCLSLSYATADGAVFAQDRLQRGYAAGPACAAGVAHAQRRAPGEQYFGLGDKGGPLDLAGRRLRCAMTDALGSDPASGDPGYKHWPFLLVRSSGRGFSGVSPPADGAIAIGGGRAVPSESPAEQQLPSPPPCYGMFYDVDDECVFDLGCEHSNYHGAYRLFEAPAAPELDLYVFLGPSLPAATSRFAKLTGMCPLPPRWALGYGATAMPLADDPRAAARIAAFADELADRGVPASSFHFGSGYTMTAAGLRLTFEWNAERYPDPAGLVRRLRGANRLRVVANVKPVLLLAHPRFAEAAAAGLLLRDGSPGGDPAKPRVRRAAPPPPRLATPCAILFVPALVLTPVSHPTHARASLFWDAEGAGLDFQNPAAAAWWRARATASLLGVGVDALWNDNNEARGRRRLRPAPFLSSHHTLHPPAPLPRPPFPAHRSG